MKDWLFIILVSFSFGYSSCNPHPAADRIYLNAKIWTGDSSNPEAKAIAIKDSLILYV